MTATIIPFRQCPPKPSKTFVDPYDAMLLDFIAEVEALRERRRDPTPLPGEPGYLPPRAQPRKGELVRMVRERAQAKRAARKPPEGAR